MSESLGDDLICAAESLVDAEGLARIERARLLVATIAMVARHDPGDAMQVMAAAIEDLGGAGRPPVPFLYGDLRKDAEWWADIATPVELELYVAAGLRAITRTAFAERARKRIFVGLWESFTPDFQKSFLACVDPNGKFRRSGG